jgi:hypothetical protein
VAAVKTTFIEFLNTIPMNISERHNAKTLIKFGNSRYVRTVYHAHARQVVAKLAEYGYTVTEEQVFECARTNEWV